jgi:hypothetical protein
MILQNQHPPGDIHLSHGDMWHLVILFQNPFLKDFNIVFERPFMHTHTHTHKSRRWWNKGGGGNKNHVIFYGLSSIKMTIVFPSQSSSSTAAIQLRSINTQFSFFKRQKKKERRRQRERRKGIFLLRQNVVLFEEKFSY